MHEFSMKFIRNIKEEGNPSLFCQNYGEPTGLIGLHKVNNQIPF